MLSGDVPQCLTQLLPPQRLFLRRHLRQGTGRGGQLVP
eukprot:SAG31_NODE_45256_length_259_cov_0.975000_1_plen_37_part_01